MWMSKRYSSRLAGSGYLLPTGSEAVRSTSANLTWRRISLTGTEGTCIKLVTFGVAIFASSRIFAATSGELAFPEMETTSPVAAT